MTRLETAPAAAQWLRGKLRERPGEPSGTLRSDSRALRPGDAFLAWPGRATDARHLVPAALAAGAAACVVEDNGVATFGFDDTRVASLPDLQAHSGVLADIFYGAPSAQLQVLACTGTNGKTSTAWWLAQALSALGQRCAVVGTLGAGQPPAAGQDAGSLLPTGLTTPDAVTLQTALNEFAAEGFAAVALEASSIGLVEKRLVGTRIAVALFSNLTQDHLDFHGDMAAYWAAKRQLFDWPGLRAAALNVDDTHGAELASELAASPTHRALDIWTVSTRSPARLQAVNLRHALVGVAFDVLESSSGPVRQVHISTTLVGEFNANNLLLVMASLRALGVPLHEAAAAAEQVTAVPGRLQRVQQTSSAAADIDVLVDYAHTPDALDKTLAALRPLANARGGRLWCVFGCGGDRDASKRPLMGAVAACAADQVVLTSDNPRSEAPESILAQILAGAQGPAEVHVIADRRSAIFSAVQRARAGDVILLAGKGHETSQEVSGVKTPFSDLSEARAALALRAATSLEANA